MKGRVLVTGAAGFVGRHLCRALVESGVRVRATGRGAAPVGSAAYFEWIHVPDVGPTTDWSSALDGVTAVVHLAAVAHRMGGAPAESEYSRVNEAGTRCLATAVRSAITVQRLVFVSSIGAVCSVSNAVVNEETVPMPDTPYGRSKLQAEKAVREVLGPSSVDWTIFRPPLIYGPGNPGNMARLLSLVRTGLPLPFGAIRNRRSFIYVGNVVHAIIHSLSAPKAARRTFVISDSQAVSTPELIRMIAAATSRRVWLLPVPVPALRIVAGVGRVVGAIGLESAGILGYSIDRIVGSLEVSASRIWEEIGWLPPHSMQEGLAFTLVRSTT